GVWQQPAPDRPGPDDVPGHAPPPLPAGPAAAQPGARQAQPRRGAPRLRGRGPARLPLPARRGLLPPRGPELRVHPAAPGGVRPHPGRGDERGPHPAGQLAGVAGLRLRPRPRPPGDRRLAQVPLRRRARGVAGGAPVYPPGSQPMKDLLRRRKLLLALAVLLLLLAGLWLFRPSARAARVKALQQELFGEAGRKLTPQERREKFQQLRRESAKLTPAERNDVWSAQRKRRREELDR